MADKLALRNEGIAEKYLEINGAWEDHVRYAMTSEEWDERRDELEAAWLTRRDEALLDPDDEAGFQAGPESASAPDGYL